jgi:hypothetical protein
MNKLIAILALVVFNANVFANANPIVIRMNNPEKGVFVLDYKGTSNVVKIKITDTKGKVIYTETIKGYENFKRPYNFANMPEGEYVIEVKNNEGVTKETFIHAKNEVALDDFSFVAIMSGKKENSFDLVVVGDQKELMNVEIFDGKKVIYTEKIDAKGNFKRTYVIKETIKEELIFTINGVTYNPIQK